MWRLAVLVVLAAAGSAAAAPPSLGAGPTIRDCTSLAVAPSDLTIACGDGNFGLARMRWSSWGRASTSGTGVVRANDCTPNCAAGRFHEYAVVATASRLRTCLGGRRQYTRLDLRYTRSVPAVVRSMRSTSLPCGSDGLGPRLTARRAGARIVLTGSAWPRSATCTPTVELSTGGRLIARAALDAKGGFYLAWRPPRVVGVIVAREECHSAALGERLFEAAVAP
jgi:hypothetical protein